MIYSFSVLSVIELGFFFLVILSKVIKFLHFSFFLHVLYAGNLQTPAFFIT